MTVRFTVVEPARALDDDLRAQLLQVWCDVTDAGGSVGFVPPAPSEEIDALLGVTLRGAASDDDVLGVLRDETGVAVGMGTLAGPKASLFAHWRTVLKVMVHPSLQGTGAGSTLMEGLHGEARRLGLDHLYLTVRGGEGLERFYERFGYRVVGAHPGAIRVALDDTRDEVFLVAEL